MKLDRGFYERNDVVRITREVIGMVLLTRFNGKTTGGRIVEAEAYSGARDMASHAFRGKTNRTQVMFKNGGIAYVYLCYGIHNLFNIVTNRPGKADAVLIRALEPLEGIGLMARRRKMDSQSVNLTSGPGKLSRALGIKTVHNGADLLGNRVWIELDSHPTDNQQIEFSKRVGVGYAGQDANLPWRFFLKGNKYVSKV